MKLKYMKINNFRNIDNIEIYFDGQSNYIIGENNIGKSNFLGLLDIVFNCRSFNEDDYASTDMPISVDVSLHLEDEEIGFFEDTFSPDSENCLNMKIEQKIEDAYLSVYCTDTEERISLKDLRKIHYIKYDTTLSPSKELKINSKAGAGSLFKGIVENYFKDDESIDFLNKEQIVSLTDYINEHLSKIKAFSDYGIKASVATEPRELLSRLFSLSNDDRVIDEMGSGVQYASMAAINILYQIFNIYNRKSSLFTEQIYVNKDGKKILPIILAIDEPEVHLHPFLQRSLIGYYKRILSNQDENFVALLQFCFGIDGIDGQLIIVTHSTDCLIGNYRNLIRFYKTTEGTKVVSGVNLSFDGSDVNEKHLIMHFPYVKEAFYSHCVILFEGETEYGCIGAFAEKMNILLDDYNICAINAHGEGSIKPLKILLEKFKIPSIAIYDADVKESIVATENDFFTDKPCFEFDIVDSLIRNGKKDLLVEIVKTIANEYDRIVLNENYVKKAYKKIGASLDGYEPKRLSEIDMGNDELVYKMFSSYLYVKKDVILGRIIG